MSDPAVPQPRAYDFDAEAQRLIAREEFERLKSHVEYQQILERLAAHQTPTPEDTK